MKSLLGHKGAPLIHGGHLWRRRIALGIVATVCVGGVWVAQQGHVAATNPGYREYVALGDSVAAAPTVVPLPMTDHAPLGCDQAPYNYPRQIAAGLGVPVFRDASCSAATTAHMTSPQSVPGGSNAPQFDRLTSTTDLVTLSIGANDVETGPAVYACINPLPLSLPQCKPAIDKVRARIPQMEQSIGQVIQGIHERSPNANVFFLSYISLFSPRGCWPVIPIADPDMAQLNRMWADIQAAMGRAASAAGARVVDVYGTSIGHDPCTGPAVRWAEGLVPLSLNGVGAVFPFHPNSAGADAQSRLGLAAIRAVPPIAVTATTTTTTTITPSTTIPATAVTSPTPTTFDAATTQPPTSTDPPAAPSETTSPPATDPSTTAVPPTEPPVSEPPAATTSPPATDPTTTAVPPTEPPVSEPAAGG